MLNTLFKMENIKYIISVDDCFAIPKEDHMREEIYIDALISFDKLKPLFVEFGKDEEVNDIEELKNLNMDISSNLQSLIDSLRKEEIEKCFSAVRSVESTLSEEQKGILEFLESLKSEKIIENYITLPSTHEAEQLDISNCGMTDGAILWLIDKSFTNAGESANAGIELAKNMIKRTEISNNFVFLLTTIENSSDVEEEIEAEFDELLKENGTENSSFMYFISKNLVLTKKIERVAKSLAFGFKRKQCCRLMKMYIECLRDSCDKAIDRLQTVDQKTLNYVFTNKVEANGESHFDFFARLVQIFHESEYGTLLTVKIQEIFKGICHYKELCKNVPQDTGNESDALKVLKNVRKNELFDMNVNRRFSEISTGDIFKIDDMYYILVTQPCDTYLRKDGTRKLNNAILLRIIDSPDNFYKYELSCFCENDDSMNKPAVIYQENKILPFEILDLCVTNEDGCASIDTSCFNGEICLEDHFSENYKLHYENLIKFFFEAYNNKVVLDGFVEKHSKESSYEKLKKAYTYIINSDTDVCKFNICGTKLNYPIKRIARLNELQTISLLKEYGNVLSRIGQPFDFIKS